MDIGDIIKKLLRSLRIVSERGRGFFKGLFEESRKILRIGDIDFFGDLAHIEVGIHQKLDGFVHFAVDHVLVNGHTCLLDDQSVDIVGVISEDLADRRVGGVVLIFLLNIGQNFVR